MRKHLFYLLLLGAVFLQAQVTPEIEWAKALGSEADDFGGAITPTADGGYLVFGYVKEVSGSVTGPIKGGSDYWVTKLDADGEIVWDRTYGGSSHDDHTDARMRVIPASDGGYILAGNTRSSDGDVSQNHGMGDVWLVKIDEDGDIDWEKSYGGSKEDYFRDIEPTEDGGYIMTAATQSNDGDVTSEYILLGSRQTAWVVKLDNSGNIEWSNDVGGYETYTNEFHSIYPTDDGYIATGWTDGIGGDIPSDGRGSRDYWVVKMGLEGEVIWSKLYGGSTQDKPFDVKPTSDGGFIVIGDIYGSGGDVTEFYGTIDMWVIKLDSEGELEWEKSYGGSFGESGRAIKQSVDGNFVIGGGSASNDGDFPGKIGEDTPGTNDYILMKIDQSNGDIIWQKRMGGTQRDNLWRVEFTSEGGFVVVGTTYSFDGDVEGHYGTGEWTTPIPSFPDFQKFEGNFDLWVVKLSPDCLVPDFTVETEFVVCEGEDLSIAVTTDGDSVNWYESADAETPFFTGTTLELENLTETVTYWVEALSYVCAAERTEVTITVNPVPELILDEVEFAVCAGENANLFAFSEGNVIFWYENEEDEEYLYHGNNFIVEDLAEGTHTYWVEAYNLATGCVSEREEVTITVNPVPNAPEAIGNFEFEEGDTLADLEDSLGYEGELTWYADEYLSVELPATTTLVDGAIYYVTQTIGDCESEGLAVQVEESTLSTTNIRTTDFAYYPNPVKDKLNFTGKEKVESLQVFDMSGRLVLTEAAKGQALTSINLSALPAGAYLLKVKTDKGMKMIRIVRN